VTTTSELNDEEQAILIYVRRRLEEAGMLHALRLVNEGSSILDVRAILNYYREEYEREGRH
jgi:hypothetical protein